jgi:hypothetical protein
MKNKTRILCFVLWGVCLFGVFHIQYLQKLEAQQLDKDKQEDYHDTDVRSSYERADNTKKNIINILILIIQNS